MRPSRPGPCDRSGCHRHGRRQGGWYRGAAADVRLVPSPADRRRSTACRSPVPTAARRSPRPAVPRARRCSRAGTSRRSSTAPCTDGARPALGLLRGPADRQRQARRPPRRGPRLQGPVPAVQDDEGLSRPAPRRLGLPRPARRARGREGARLLRQAGHRGLRGRRVQREVPRVGAAPRRRVRAAHRAHGLLDRHGRRLPDHGHQLHRVRLVEPEDDLGQGPAGPGQPRRAVLPPLPDRPCPTTRWRRATPTSSTRASTSASRSSGQPYDLLVWTTTPWTLVSNTAVAVHPEVDYAVVEVPDGRPAAGRRAAGRGRRRRRRGGARAPSRAASSRARLPTPARPDRRGQLRRGRPPRRARRLRDRRRRHRPGAPGAGVRRGGPRGRPALRAGGRQPGPPRRHVRADVPLVGGQFFKTADDPLVEELRAARGAVAARAVRAQLSALLAVRHPAALLRAPVLVHPHDRDQGPAARRERGHPLVPGPDQERSLRRVAARQRRLGAVPQPLLGHAAADLDLRRRGRAPGLRRLARRARRAGRSGPVGAGPAPAVRRTTSCCPAASAAAGCTACPRSSTSGTTPAPCRSPSGERRTASAQSSRRATRRSTSARRSTRPAAGSTR